MEEKNLVCKKCGHEIEKDSTEYEYKNEFYCEDCYNETFSICEGCNDVFFRNDLVSHSDEFYCEDCYNDNFTICNHCDEYFPNSEISDDLCNDCTNEHYFHCYGCGELYHLDDEHYSESRGESFCESCYPAENENIHDSSYRPNFEFYGKDKIYLGFELEVECNDRKDTIVDYVNDNFPELYLKEDGSLTDGMEIVSHPCSLDYHINNLHIERLLKHCRENKAKSHDTKTCGLHVHASKNFFSEIELIKLAGFVYSNKTFFEILARRSESSYAKFKNKPQNGKEIKGLSHSAERYEAINFQNSKTVEFRLFKGTLKYDTLIATLELCHVVSFFIKEINLHEAFKPQTKEKFLDYIAKSNYKFLKTYIKEKVK